MKKQYDRTLGLGLQCNRTLGLGLLLPREGKKDAEYQSCG